MNLTIRSAHLADLHAILTLLAQNSMNDSMNTPEPALPSPQHCRAFETIDAHPDHTIAVGTLNDEVVATLQLSFLPGLAFQGAWRAQIEGVRVRSDLRSHGLGTQMIHWAIALARARGCHLVQLTSNQARTDARRFYERLGFKASHVGMKLYL
jgi:GNAT superfamily N-acetyltransferase